jgi:hypothetical protein
MMMIMIKTDHLSVLYSAHTDVSLQKTGTSSELSSAHTDMVTS